MNKALSILLTAVMVFGLAFVSACKPDATATTLTPDSTQTLTQSPPVVFRTPKPSYAPIDPKRDYYAPYIICADGFETVNALIQASTRVLAGRITDISFQILDASTAEIATEIKSDHHYVLSTLYQVDVLETYKGLAEESTVIAVFGGKRDYQMEEQLSLLAELDRNLISVIEEMPEIKIGESYLFALYQKDASFPMPLTNGSQSVFNLHDPFKANFESPVDSKYSFAAKDIISAFGQKQWDTFWDQWQRDNPKWETWIDKAEIQEKYGIDSFVDVSQLSPDEIMENAS